MEKFAEIPLTNLTFFDLTNLTFNIFDFALDNAGLMPYNTMGGFVPTPKFLDDMY